MSNKNEGFVCYRADRKTYCARYPELNPVTNKTIMKSKSFKTKEEAQKYLDTIMYQKDNSLYIEHHGIPLCEFMKSNLKLKLDTNQITPTTYYRVLQVIKQIQTFPIGIKNIDEITDEELQEYLNYHKNLSNSTITKLYQQLNSTFKIAINKGYLMRNPMINVLKPKSNKQDKEVRALTVEEQQSFTDYLLSKDLKQCKYKNVFLIQMYMGLRCGETLALTTHDIDLKHKKMNIHRTLTTDENNAIIMGNKTKTYAGKRVIPIPDFIYPHIIEQMQIAENQENNEEKLLFKPYNARYTRRTNVNSELQRILERYFDITDISTHSLRHTFGTRCIESGMAPVVVQRLMGHKDISVTLNTYTSVFDEFKAREIDKVNQYYLNENMIKNNLLNEENSIENER